MWKRYLFTNTEFICRGVREVLGRRTGLLRGANEGRAERHE